MKEITFHTCRKVKKPHKPEITMYVKSLDNSRLVSKKHPNKKVYVDWNNADHRLILENGIIVHGKERNK